MKEEIRQGDCIEEMAKLDESSIDAVVCDPPYGLGFMGTAWDTIDGRTTGTQRRDASVRYDHVGGNHNPVDSADAARTRRVENQKAQEWHYAWATEALRVLKPGGHLLAFGGTRTSHRLACAVEDAGFEIRDSVIWLYGSGFPKSLDVSKAIDKAARGVPQGSTDPTSVNHGRYRTQATEGKRDEGDAGRGYGAGPGQFMAEAGKADERELVESAQQWQGWGTALKPAHEPIVVARKPLVGTVARNVQEHGTGALNVDGCRVGTEDNLSGGAYAENPSERHDGTENWRYKRGQAGEYEQPSGRWPANVVLDEEAAGVLDAQSGETKSGTAVGGLHRRSNKDANCYGHFAGERTEGDVTYGDSGGASRFFYCAKSSRAERNAGLEGFEKGQLAGSNKWTDVDYRKGDGEVTARPRANVHPTVKPIALMRWLCRLVTPPGGLILDPFAGSGTTGCAAILEGFDFLGIEREAEYVEIAKARIAHWAAQPVQLGLEAA